MSNSNPFEPDEATFNSTNPFDENDNADLVEDCNLQSNLDGAFSQRSTAVHLNGKFI